MQGLTVKQLIDALKQLDQDLVAALSTDSEGNSFSLIPNEMFMTDNVYIRNELGSQEYYFEKNEVEGNDSEKVVDFFGKEHDKKELTKALILWPSN